MPSDPRASPSPRRVVRMGKYEVTEHIATGGMAAVYRARDTEANQDVALKVLSADASKPALVERFRREARAAAKMRHENIVRLFEDGEISGTYYIAMELVRGADLHDHIKRKGTLDPEEARQIVLQAARALRHAAEHGIVHRDIKPSNFLLARKDGRLLVKLTDFGLAREIDADEYRVTRAGTTVGTVDYMSPEQARDSSAADGRSDLYSLGVTWYQMLVGHVPFPKGGLGERLIKIIHDPPPDARELNPQVSDETWAILEKLLAKDPAKRYQEPSELIEDLLTLEGKAAARPESPREKRKARPRRRRPGSTDAAVPATIADADGKKLKRIILGMCAAAAVILGLLIWWITRPSPPPEHVDHPPPPAPVGKRPDDDGKKLAGRSDKGKPPDKPPDKPPRWPRLYKGAVDAAALRREVEAPFAGRAAPAGAFVAKVRRSPGAAAGTYATLEEALAAAPAGQAAVIEVHDNGPLFATGLDSDDRALTIRAGQGYRPLIIWDVPAAAARRAREKKDEQPLVFVKARGRLELSGLEVACQWGARLEPGTLLDVQGGDLILGDCTFSAAGRPRGGLTLARLRAAQEGARCRFTRVQARGAALTALDLDAPAAEVLFDGCLLVGGGPALVRLRAALVATKVRAVRSTLIGGDAILDVRPAAKEGKASLTWLGWDALLCRAGAGEGALLSLRDGARPGDVMWRAVNCAYAGWKHLLAGPVTIAGDDNAGWRQQFNLLDGDLALGAAWPAQAASEPAIEPASSYQPDGAVGYASTLSEEAPLGADLKALPPCRDGWAELLEITPSVLDFPSDESAPAIPAGDEGKYHGGRVDLTDTDLGAFLDQQARNPGLGPRVVLHLAGKGERTTSPLRVKGATLVLYFEPPADKEDKPLVLRLSSTTVAPLVEVTGGGLEVIGGTLRLPNVGTAKASHVVSVSGGDVRLYRVKLEGPQQAVPEGYEAAVRFKGAGEAAEKPAQCLLNECVVLSSRGGVVIDGAGARLGLRGSLVVAGGDGLRLLPGEGCKSGPAMQVTLESVTLACRGAAVYLGDAPNVGVPAVPAVVRAVNCAYLNPFPARPKAVRAGLLAHEADALARGLLLWRGEKEAFDLRLDHGAWPAGVALPARKAGLAAWPALWGSGGTKERRPDLVLFRELDAARWALDRLQVPMVDPPGANVRRLIDMGGKP